MEEAWELAAVSMVSRHIPNALKKTLLEEAGYRCANPTCRGTSALQFEHILDWAELDPKVHKFEDMIVLCATCHARVTSGEIEKQAVRNYKRNLAVIAGRYSLYEFRFLEYLNSLEPWSDEDLAENDKWAGKIVLAATQSDLIHLSGFIRDGFVVLRDAPMLVEQLRKHMVGDTILHEPLRDHFATVMNFPTKAVIPTKAGIDFMRKYYAGDLSV